MDTLIEIFPVTYLYSETLQTLLITVSVIAFLYWEFFYRTFDFYRDYSDIGFEVVKDKARSNLKHQNLINELRKRRKVGDLPPSYPNGWFGILESDKLKIGKAVEVEALGFNLVAWRGESGKVYLADAYCPHLGAHLGVGGKVAGECIQCPFHSWKFDGDKNGKLTSIPYSLKMPEFVNLKMYLVLETNGFIFLWHHAEKEEPTWFPDECPEVNKNIWAYRGRSEFRIACHIQEIPENGPDVAHLNVIHGDAILCGDNPSTSLFSWSFVKHIWEAKWSPNTSDPKRTHEAILLVKHYLQFFNRIPFFKINVDVRQLGPGVVHMYFDTWFGKGFLVQTVTPIEPLLQVVTHRFYSSPTFIHPIAKLILYGEAQQISRDVRIWNRKCFLSKPILPKEDAGIKVFRRWYSQFYSKNSHKLTTNSNGIKKDLDGGKFAF